MGKVVNLAEILESAQKLYGYITHRETCAQNPLQGCQYYWQLGTLQALQ